jgi:hypothetical protein
MLWGYQYMEDLRVLCYEHHTEMLLDCRSRYVETFLYACQEPGCLIRYYSSQGYFIEPKDGHRSDPEIKPSVHCPKDGRVMYLALISHSVADGERTLFEPGVCELISRDVVVKVIRFPLFVRVFLCPRMFRRTPCRRLTETRERLFGLFLFQYFSGTAHSFLWTCWNSATLG